VAAVGGGGLAAFRTAVAADVAHRDLGAFAGVADVLGEFLAALFGQRRHVEANGGAGRGRGDAKVRGHDRLFHRGDGRFFVRDDGERAGVRHGHGGDLVERHIHAVIAHLDAFHQRGAGAARAQVRQLVEQGLDALAHAGLAVAFDVVKHGVSGGVENRRV
jgi:hypothetical protein